MSDTIVAEPRKFKLRRVKPNPHEDVIKKNLEPLKENIRKKKFAQELYYENHNDCGLSPLIRDFKKRPVHQRLGRRVPFNGTNTSAIPPKKRFRKLENQPNIRRMRIFSAQQRLNRIRANQREVLQSNANTPKRIKLRRTLPQFGPTNLMVHVKNNSFVNRQQISQHNFLRFRQKLDIQLQQEIKKIQMDFQGVQSIDPIRITPAATSRPMHQRFAELS